MNVSDLAKELAKDKNVLAVLVFGSVATGKTKPMSDIDVAVMLSPYDINSAAFAEASSGRKLDVVVFNDLPPFIQFNVLKEGKILFCRDNAQFRQHALWAMKNYHFHLPLYEKFKAKVPAGA